MTDPDTPRTARELAALAAQLNTATSVSAAVDTFLGYAVPLVGADTASVMLLHHGRDLRIAGTTNDTAEYADRLQLQTREGPGVDAAHDLTPVDGFAVHGIAAEARWPRWCSQLADELGIGSVLSVQLCLPGRSVGALTLYAAEPERFSHDDLSVGHLLAEHAAIAFTQLCDPRPANHSGRAVGMAINILMGRYDLTEDAAFAVLRRYAQSHHRKLRDIAEDLIGASSLPPCNGRTANGT